MKNIGTIITNEDIVVAKAPPSIPKRGIRYNPRPNVIIHPNIKMYIGTLGFPIPCTILPEIVYIE